MKRAIARFLRFNHPKCRLCRMKLYKIDIIDLKSKKQGIILQE